MEIILNKALFKGLEEEAEVGSEKCYFIQGLIEPFKSREGGKFK